MLISSIDIGSNTILLLIVEYDTKSHAIRTIRNEYRVPRISQNLKTNLIISNEKITEMWNVLEEYDSILNELNVDLRLAVATNAFRIAKNGVELADKIRYHFKYGLKILNGDEEARLSFLGSLPDSKLDKNFLVLDIGGGSTEIILGSKKKILFKKSFNVGVVSLFEKYLSSEPPTLYEIRMIEEKLDKEFKLLQQNEFSFESIIAVAGTPTTLSCMLQGKKTYDEKSVDNSIISVNEIKSIIETLTKITTTQVRDIYGEVVKGRE
ncbi:MAG: hypothetical protein GYA14_05660, partial [Ignavibacteria bacterium]|nr:hypothetical protein [Ignavibacteria bacterium]